MQRAAPVQQRVAASASADAAPPRGASRRRQPVADRGRAVGCPVDDRGCRVLLNQELPAEYTQQSMNNRVIARFWNCVPSAPAVYQRRRRSSRGNEPFGARKSSVFCGFWAVLNCLFQNRHLNFLYIQKIDDDGQKMAKAAMALYGIDQIDQVVREAWKPRSFGQPSTCNSPRAAPEARHGPSPWRSASRLHRTAPAATTQRGAVLIQSAPASQPRSELPHVVVQQEGAARLIRRRQNQQLGCCWRSIARTSSRERLSGRPARCGWSRPAPPQAAAAVGEALRSSHRSQQ